MLLEALLAGFMFVAGGLFMTGLGALAFREGLKRLIATKNVSNGLAELLSAFAMFMLGVFILGCFFAGPQHEIDNLQTQVEQLERCIEDLKGEGE